MKTVVGLFRHFEEAQQAVRGLSSAGFKPNNINMIAADREGKYSKYVQGDTGQKEDVSGGAAKGAGLGAVLGGLGGLLVGLGALAIPGIGPVIAAGPIAAALAGAGVGAVAGGAVGALVDLGIPEEHAKMYAEGIKRGGTLVAVQTDDQQAAQAERILNQYNPVDVNNRTDAWWQQQSMDETNMVRDESVMPVTGSRMDPTVERDMTNRDIPRTGNQPDMNIPVVEEDIRVGKREVDRGGVRVDTHVTEEPVEKDINLRQEHVTVERRPVDRPVTDQDMNNFKEGTFEVRETGEEPVVEKRARVVEEVNINKDVNEETRTITDSVRKTEVDVQPMGQGMDRDWNTFDQNFRQDYQTRYASFGNDYNYYSPAYRYGYDLARNDQYRGYDWTRMEPIARQDWQRRGMKGEWNQFKDAVRYAWESATMRR